MEVIVTRADLKSHNACLVYLDSPEWSPERDALVYLDWDATVQRLLSSRLGVVWLNFLVARGLVPMSLSEFAEARKAREK